MKIFLLGKRASITHWLEDVASAFRSGGHEVAVGLTRRPWLNSGLEAALATPIADRIVQRMRRFSPDLILAIGGYHLPPVILDAVASVAGRPPLIGWVGDLFDEAARTAAGRFDAVAYTDSGLSARHAELGLAARTLFLPHAVDPGGLGPLSPPGPRSPRMVFVANATTGRTAVVSAVCKPVTLYGPGWGALAGGVHERHARRVAKRSLGAIYGGYRAALNIRNENNVLSGLNQRNFEPGVAGAVIITDDQPDLELCFEPGREVLAWRDVDELNACYERVLRDPQAAEAIGARGRRRVLADHTYAARLKTLTALL